jgi:hypothetical protein
MAPTTTESAASATSRASEPRNEIPQCIVEAAEAAWAALEARDRAATGRVRRSWTVADLQFDLTVERPRAARRRTVRGVVASVGTVLARINGTHEVDAYAARGHADRLASASSAREATASAFVRTGGWHL